LAFESENKLKPTVDLNGYSNNINLSNIYLNNHFHYPNQIPVDNLYSNTTSSNNNIPYHPNNMGYSPYYYNNAYAYPTPPEIKTVEEPLPEEKTEVDKFDFVNDLLKKKK